MKTKNLTCSDFAIGYVDVMGRTYVDSISIRACGRCSYFQIGSCDPEAISECDMRMLAIDYL